MVVIKYIFSKIVPQTRLFFSYFVLLLLLLLNAGNVYAGQPIAILSVSNVNGLEITFDASLSSNPDGTGIASYQWTFGDGTNPVTTTDSSVTHLYPADGSYPVFLTVLDNDMETNSASINVQVTAPPPDTIPPQALAGPDQTVTVGTSVTLDGSLSSDNVGITHYDWSFTTHPEASGAVITDASAKITNFIPDLPGTYLVSLVVSDAAGLLGTDEVKITATPAVSMINIDIIPFSSTNPVLLCKGVGLIPVAILGSSSLNVADIDISSLQLGNLQLKLVGKTSKLLCAKAKINNDAFVDLTCIYAAKDTGIATSVNSLPLTGKLLNGTNISGSDSVKIIKCK